MIVRVSKTTGNYSIIHNHPLNDPRLSLKAKGLAGYLLTKPDTWAITITNIENYNQDGQDAIKAALQELEKCGYLKRRRVNNPMTGLLEWERTLYETPTGSHLIEMQVALDRAKSGKRPLSGKKQSRKKSPSGDKPLMDKPLMDKPLMDKPLMDKPLMDKPLMDKPPLVITDQTSTELVNTELENTESEITECRDDDDDGPPSFVKEKNSGHARDSARVREALTDKGQWSYNPDFIYALGIQDDELRTAALRALEAAEINDDFDDLSSYLTELNARQCQRLMLWSYKLRFDDDWASKIDDPVGFIRAKIDSNASFRPWQRSRLAWFIHYCLTGEYKRFEDLHQEKLIEHEEEVIQY